MTDFDTEWSVDKYYDETEPEVHWDLRKEFMLLHKERYPEQYLVSLARVFTNIEFMGCSYSKELMALIADLSKDVADLYRKQKSTKLQRTFVKASDAAESKFSDNFMNNQTNCGLIQKAQCQQGFRGRIVLVKHTIDEKPWVTIQKAASVANVSVAVKLTGKTDRDHNRGFNIVLGGEIIADGFAKSEKEAKDTLGPNALKNLQQTCFTIERKIIPTQEGQSVTRSDKNKSDKSVCQAEENKIGENKLSSNNIGMKMMKLMGWSGKGLGKDEDGRENCIDVKEHMSRSGLGCTDNLQNSDFRKKLSNYVYEYAISDKTHNLIFSADFTTDERKYVHSLAAKYNLRSKSYGKDSNRQLVVSRKVTAWEIVRDLLETGGCTSEYNLIIPANFKLM